MTDSTSSSSKRLHKLALIAAVLCSLGLCAYILHDAASKPDVPAKPMTSEQADIAIKASVIKALIFSIL